MVNLDKYVGSCNTLNDLPNKVCVPNKTEDLILSVESEILTYISIYISIYHSNVNINLMVENVIQIRKCRKCNAVQSGIMINVDVSVKI